MTDPRPYTPDEARELFLEAVRGCVHYWSKMASGSEADKISGVAFSILNLIDGTSGQYPASLDLVVRVHPDDAQYHRENGDNWHEEGTVLNESAMLHDQLYR